MTLIYFLALCANFCAGFYWGLKYRNKLGRLRGELR